MPQHPITPTMKVLIPPPELQEVGSKDGSVLIFTPLGTPQTSSSCKSTPPPHQVTSRSPLGTPLTGERGGDTAMPPVSTSTPADRSVLVRISARKLREIDSPYTSDQSLASLQSDVLAATGASPGAPAPPPQAPGGPATPPQTMQLVQSSPPFSKATSKAPGVLRPALPPWPTIGKQSTWDPPDPLQR